MPSDLLKRLVRESAEETARRRQRMPMAEVERRAAAAPAPRDLARALRRPGRLAVIAEMKARTPSMGELAAGGYSPAGLARAYEAGGAAAISVLCQETSFGGSIDHLVEARAVTTLPLLRKDFISAEYQVAEARAAGADGVLLIAAALPAARLKELLDYTRSLGMEALVEVHEQPEVPDALTAGALVIGVNHRNLRTFEVDIGLTERMRPLVPSGCVLVAESGIHDARSARAMRLAGADAVLVGEALMRSGDPAAKVRELAAA
jgi:indole-3-glycerol phosphate synthase